MIRVMVSARSAVVRAGLAAVIRTFPEMAEAGPENADVLLASGDLESIDVPAGGEPPTVLLADDSAPESTVTALRAGARAVLPPDASKEEIRAAIHAAAVGLVTFRQQEFEAVFGALPVPLEPASDSAAQPLSPRELEILRLLAAGMANKAIAWQLGISEHTVKFHVAAILSRLNAGSRTEAVTIGIRHGLIMI